MPKKVIPASELEALHKSLRQLKHGQKEEREAVFRAYRVYGSKRTLSRRLQEAYGRVRKVREDAGETSELLLKCADLVAKQKLKAQRISGRWISTSRAIEMLLKEGKIPENAGVSVNSVNRLIKEQKLLEVRKSHEIVGAPYPFFRHFWDCSGSICLRSVSFDPAIVETCPANHSEYTKNHRKEALGRKQLFLIGLVDAFSGFLMCEYLATPGVNSFQVSDFLLRQWKRWGRPDFVSHDRGSENFGAVDNLLMTLGIDRIKSKAGNSKANGAIERAFRTIWADFESSLVLEKGLGFRMKLEELNETFQKWLGEVYNARASRMGGRDVSRAEVYANGVQQGDLRQVDEHITVPTVEFRKLINVGRGCVQWHKDLYEIEHSQHLTSGEVQVFCSDGSPLFILNDKEERINLTRHVPKTGLEFLDFKKSSGVSPEKKWNVILLSLGFTESQLASEIGEIEIRGIKQKLDEHPTEMLIEEIKEML